MEQLFIDYMERLNEQYDQFRNAISGLSVEALDWSPGRDMNSLCVLIVHTTGSTGFWVGDVAAGIVTAQGNTTKLDCGRK